MKHYNPFDFYENNENNIDEQTIYENTGVSYNNIKSKVFKNIRSTQKKRIKKSRFLALVAIIVIIASLSTTAYATGTFNDIFGYLFSGKCVDGFYTGGDAEIECSDDNLNVEFLGISAGSESEVFVAYKLTKKDGTDFEFVGDNFKNGEVCFNEGVSEIEENYIAELLSFSYDSSYNVTCTMTDSKTIMVYVYYTTSTDNIRGQKLHTEFNTLYYKRVDKFLNEYATLPFNTKEDIYAYSQTMTELEDKYGDTLGENQGISTIYNPEVGKTEFAIVTYLKYDVTIKSTVELNYKKNTKTQRLGEDTISELFLGNGNAEGVDGKVIVSPFSIKVKLEANNGILNGQDFDTVMGQTDYDGIDTLRMNDGTEYYLISMGSSSEGGSSGKGNVVIDYIISSNKDVNNLKLSYIDIDNVKEVVIINQTISLS